MISPLHYRRPLIITLSIFLHLFLLQTLLPAQTASFIAPDTVCAGASIILTNTTTGGSTFYWNFCSGNVNQNPTGVNIGNPGNLLSIPTYLTLVKQGNDCFSFISCQGVGVVRYYHGNSFKNNPVSWTNLGTFGGTITFSQEGIQVKEDNGQWYGFVCSDTKLVRLNFGASLWNTPTATSLNFTGLNVLHGFTMIKEGTTWLGFATCSTGNTMVRFNFGASLTNTPVMTDFGNFAGFNTPGAICLVQENSSWYGLISAGNSTLSRISFGASLLNTPTGTNIGNPGGINSGVALTLLRDCESTTGYYANYLSPGQLGKLTFTGGIAGTVTGQVLGNIGSLDKPHSFSEIFRQNDTLYTYITNRQNGTLTRLTFLPCTNASVPSSVLYNPPAFSYNTPGTYNVRLIVNEGLPTQSTLCKNIVVLAAPCNTIAAFTAPDTVCVGEPVALANQSSTGGTYYWSFCSGNSLSNPQGTNIGNPGSLLNIPGYMTLVKDGSTCYSFVASQGNKSLIRYNHGNSFSNNPVSWTNLGNFNLIGDTLLGLKICQDNGQWIGILNNNNRLVRLNFGASLTNTPTATLLGPYSLLYTAHCLDIIREGTTWIGFITCSWGNRLVRLNFGTSLLNAPVLTDLGTPGTMNMPGPFRFVNENGQWYCLVANLGSNTLTRLSFGTSLLNTPTGLNLGNPCTGITAGGLCLIRDCESTTGFQLNYSSTSPNLIWRLTFPTGITGTVTGTSLGNIGALSRPSQFSELFRVGDTLFVYNTNRDNFTLTRHRFLPCTNASVASSSLYNPPAFSYNQPGTYNIQLTVNEGQYDQASICKSIVVKACNTVASFTAPDTVCVGEPVSLVNQSTTGGTYYWNFCSGNTLNNPVGTNIGNPGSLLNIPVYMTLAKDGSACYSFIANQGTTSVIRYNHGNSFNNNPVSWTNLGSFGYLSDSVMGIKLCNDNGQWFGFVNNNNRVVRLNFGTSPGNAPTATLLGPYALLDRANCIDVIKEGATWIGLISCSQNHKLIRLNFGNSLLNTPTLTDLGSPGTLNKPGSFRVISENGSWYMLIVNYANSTLSRITFGNSLLNTPTGVNLGVVCSLNQPGGITLLRDCEGTVGFQLHYSNASPNLIWRLNFPQGITGTASSTALGNIGSMSRPSQFSEVFRVGDTLYLYNTNQLNGTLTRLRFLPCSNASVSSSTLYNPPSFSYSQPGTYNIQLTVNEGQYDQASICKSIVVKACNTVASFTAPDTVCTGAPVTLTNTTTGGSTYYWNFCSGNAGSTPTGTNIGNPGNSLISPFYPTLAKDGTDCFTFITNHGPPTFLTRVYHGASFRNNPVSTVNFLQTGVLDQWLEDLKIINDNGTWYGFVCNNTTILRLNFGATLWNTNPTVTNLGPFTGLAYAHGMSVVKEGNTWLLFFDSHNQNKLFRLNFGTSLSNAPTFTDFGNPAGFNHPTQIAAVRENGICYLLIANYDNNTLSRINFGNSYLNTPTGQNLGNCGGLQTPHGITVLNDCETTTGYYTIYQAAPQGGIGRLTFTGGVGGTVSAQPLGNIGNPSNPVGFTELFRHNDSLFAYVTNVLSASLTRFSFPPCTNATIPSSTQFNPPVFSYNSPGSYTIRLVVDEGLFNESSVCQSIAVMPPPVATLGPDRSICPGATTTLDAGAGFSSYLWSTGATSRMITVGTAGSYWVKVTKYDCFDYDTVAVSVSPVMPVSLGPDQAICEGQSTTFYAGFCAGCSYQWSNLSTGQPNIGTGSSYTTGIAGIYAVKVTSPDGCITGDTIQLSVNPVPVVFATPPDLSICSGSFTGITLSSTSPLASYSWTATLTSGNITGYSFGFGNSINQQLTNLDFTPGMVTYSITAALGNCFSQPLNYPVTVNPAPTITNSGAATAICSGEWVSIPLISNVSNTQFNWTATGSSPDITGLEPGTGSPISQQLFNEGFTNPVATYTVIPTALGCSGAPGTFEVTVNPIPDVSFTPQTTSVCSGTPMVILLQSQAAGATFSWEATGSSAFISNISAGAGTTIQQTPQNSGTETGMVTYTVTPVASGCTGEATPYQATVFPVPLMSVSGNAAEICSGAPFTALFSSLTTGTTFAWIATAASPLVSGFLNGAGNSINQVLVNEDVINQPVTYQVMPTANNCPGQTTSFEVAVKPLPGITVSPLNQSTCNGEQIQLSLTSAIPGGICTWTATGSSTAVTGFSPGTGNQVQQTLFTSGNSSQTVTYTAITTLNGCSGSPAVSTVTTWPVPDVSVVPPSRTICSGEPTALTLQSQVQEATFNWSASGSSNLSGFGPGTGNTINQPLTNSSNTTGTVIYTVMPTVANCPGPASHAAVTVNPKPPVSLQWCCDSVTTVECQPYLLKGGFPLGGVFSGPGVESVTGIFTPALAGTGIHQLSYSYENYYGCSGTSQGKLRVLPEPLFNCGGKLTDVRDGKQYTTFQSPDGKCWMAENLRYGTTIADQEPQQDNCLAERYVRPSGQSEAGAFYQWNEVMQYELQPGGRGLCPPDWHIPTAGEWEVLCAFLEGPGQAGGPLKDPWLSNGFHAIRSGLFYQNNLWSFTQGLYAGVMYWTSTPSGDQRAVARGLNSYQNSVSLYEGLRSNAFHVRCTRQ